ncbi:MAG: aminopeptidase family protein P, partial [Oscillospiraceae bacterium]
KLPEGGCIGFDGRTVGCSRVNAILKKCAAKHPVLSCGEDVGGLVWDNRPAISKQPVWELSEKYSGLSRAEKLKRIREALKKQGADFLAVSALDETAWALNLRGNDVAYNPVFLAYMIVSAVDVKLFAEESIFSPEIKQGLKQDGVTLCAYDEVYSALSALPEDKTLMIDPQSVNWRFMSCVPKKMKRTQCRSPIVLMKACKTEAEQNGERLAHIKDSAAVTKFICWLKRSVSAERITEISAAQKLLEFRRQQENFLGESFDPIMGYGAHGAIVHYSATPETDAELSPRGLLLSDTGAHYLEGTTDITRTIALGEVTDEEKRAFTLVLAGHLELAAMKFPYGTRGANLDAAARAPLWQHGLDFNHGTGHGVGHVLNVHEAPQRIHWRIRDGAQGAVFEAGMITSDEPGLYVEGKFGIRHENLLLCREAEKTEYGQFLCFETLTLVPFDLDAVDARYLTDRQIELLNAYHKRVYDEIAPLVSADEARWLKQATRPIGK